MLTKLSVFLQTKLSDLATSLIRTGVAIAVGVVISWALRHGINLDKAQVTGYVTPLCIGGYYAAVRWLETKYPKLGWAFGVAKSPIYAPVTPAAVAPAPKTRRKRTPKVNKNG